MLGVYMCLMSVTDAIYQLWAYIMHWQHCSGVVRSLGFTLKGSGLGKVWALKMWHGGRAQQGPSLSENGAEMETFLL